MHPIHLNVVHCVFFWICSSHLFLASPFLMSRSYRKRTVETVLSASSSGKKHADSKKSTLRSKAEVVLSQNLSSSFLHTNSSPNQSKAKNATELFHQWRNHDALDFHAFQDPQEVIQIRQALLSWYHQYRRKLPWRGDSPPWTGSTVDFIANSKNNNNNKTNKQQMVKTNQKSLTQFFNGSTTKSSISNKATSNNQLNDSTSTTTFPITPYGVWVSEIMLQQTRVEAVIPYWVKWMQSFPTIFDLAAATPEQVNAHWAGLGFYRRARFLHAGAQAVVEQYASSDHTTIQWPTTVEAWQQLPGVGRYTASAICSICFQVNVPVVDGNVCRVLSRLRGICQHVKAPVFKDQYAWTLLQPLVEDTKEPGNVNQALMELGATYCAPSGTGIEDGDPLREYYWSTRLVVSAYQCSDAELSSTNLIRSSEISTCPLCTSDGVEQVIQQWRECEVVPDMRVYGHKHLPMAPPQSAKRVQVRQVAALMRNDDDENENKSNTKWLLVQRPPTGLLAGQWEFPSICLWDSAELDPPKTKAKSKMLSTKAQDPEPPKITTRQKQQAWKTLMDTLSMDEVSSVQTVGNVPLEHVFSHVKHIMWLQTGKVEDFSKESIPTLKDGRVMKWMTVKDMNEVGITSGLKKILKAMEKHSSC